MSNITVIPLKKPRRLLDDAQSASSSLEASLRQQFQNKKRLNSSADSKTAQKRKKARKNATEAAPLTQGQIGEAAPVRYKRKGGYWWSKANVNDDEDDDDLIAQAISTSNHQPHMLNSPSLQWDSVFRRESGMNDAPTTSHDFKQGELEFDEELEEKPSTALDPAFAIPDAAMDEIVPKEEELYEEVDAQNGTAYTETQIKEEEPDYTEYNEDFFTDIKPDLLDPSFVEIVDPRASSDEPTEQSMMKEVKEEMEDYEGEEEIKEEEDDEEETDDYAEDESDRDGRRKPTREGAEARMKREKRWRIYAALGEMPPKGRPSFNETTILKAKVLKKFGPKAKELFSLDYD